MGLIKAGTLACFSPFMYLDNAFRNSQYLGVVCPDSLMGAS